MTIKKRTMERWLIDHGFQLEPRRGTGHAHWNNGIVRVAMVAHGSADMKPNDLSAVVRKLEKAGFRRQDVFSGIGMR